MPDCSVKEENLRNSSFQVSNQLPKSIRDLTKCYIDNFKYELDKFLEIIPDQPKCRGLTPVAQRPDGVYSNSLPHQVHWARRNGLLI